MQRRLQYAVTAMVMRRGRGWITAGTNCPSPCSSAPRPYSASLKDRFTTGLARATLLAVSRRRPVSERLATGVEAPASSGMSGPLTRQRRGIAAHRGGVLLYSRLHLAGAVRALELEPVARRLAMRVGEHDVAQPPFADVAERQRGVAKLHGPVRADPQEFVGVARHPHVRALDEPVGHRSQELDRVEEAARLRALQPHHLDRDRLGAMAVLGGEMQAAIHALQEE